MSEKKSTLHLSLVFSIFLYFHRVSVSLLSLPFLGFLPSYHLIAASSRVPFFFLLSRPFPYYSIISPSSAIPFDSFSLPPSSSSCSPLASCAGRGRVLLLHTPTRKSTPVMAFRVVITDDGAEKLLITSSGQWLIANTIASPLVGLQVLAMNATCPIKGQKSLLCVCLSYNGRRWSTLRGLFA